MNIITLNKIDKACETFKLVKNSNITKFNKLDDWLIKESNIFLDETKPKCTNYLRYKKG